MKFSFHFLCFLVTFIAIVNARNVEKDYDETENGDDEDNLLAKIDCKVGEKHQYMMMTQGGLLDRFADSSMMVKTKIELKCLQKQMWLNKTNGQLKNAQLFEAKILAMTPIQNDNKTTETIGSSVTIKNGRLQMAALFENLEKIPDSGDLHNGPYQPNLKVGAVNEFFTDFTKSLGELLQKLFQKMVKFLENLLHRAKNSQGRSTVGISMKCSDGNNRMSRRAKRHSFKSVDSKEFSEKLNELYEKPFKFVQLNDGSIRSIQLSASDADPGVRHFKHFLAYAFATHLDASKKSIREQSTLGDHISHYQVEYDEPDRSKVTPEQYINGMLRSKRSNSHLVSIVRTIKRSDMLASDQTGRERNQYKHKTLKLSDIDFNAQQVQLVENNILVASGGYFHSPLSLYINGGNDSLQRMKRAWIEPVFDEEHFDDTMKKYITLNLEYSMVRIVNNRWKRSTSFDDQTPIEQMSSRAMEKFAEKMYTMSAFVQNISSKQVDNNKHLWRQKRETSKPNDNIICKVSHRPFSNAVDDDLKECFEYKEFGSGWLKAYFNRSLLTGKREGKSIDSFQTKYRVGAQILGEDVFLGQVIVSKTNDLSKLRINLFGSEYIDLNLCEIRDKVFSQANMIPLLSESIWFLTRVGIKIKYDLQFKVQVPNMACPDNSTVSPSSSSLDYNNEILSRMITDQLNMIQNTKIEFGGIFDASIMIFDGEMRLKGNFDMDSNVDFSERCVSARSAVRPMNVSMDFNFKFFNPYCGEWMEDSWKPSRMSWRLHKPYHSSWFDNVCI
ncbi:hypothetical protein BLOT_004395 [Blomia tropicalis]|nr:hypothetical protein BLOT_004395 [Blomia tropicalis]